MKIVVTICAILLAIIIAFLLGSNLNSNEEKITNLPTDRPLSNDLEKLKGELQEVLKTYPNVPFIYASSIDGELIVVENNTHFTESFEISFPIKATAILNIDSITSFSFEGSECGGSQTSDGYARVICLPPHLRQ